MADSSKRKAIWLLPTLVLLVIAGCWLVLRVMYPPYTPLALPVPNGYTDLLQAAELLAPRTGFYGEMDAEELATVVEQNRPALVMARKALKKKCLVPVDWSADAAGLDKHLEMGSSLRELARAFAAAARQANSQQNSEAAVSCGLDMLELAPVVGQGGLAVDRMIAHAVYFTGMYSLREQVELLSRDDCLRLQKKLQAFPLQLETLEEVLRREKAYFRQTRGAIDSLMVSGAMTDQYQQARESMQISEKRLETLNVLLQTHLALHAFQLDKKHLPDLLTQLAPGFFEKLPLDPFASGQLIYLVQTDGYLLYSVGPNGIDDGGTGDADSKSDDLQLEIDD